VHAESTSETPLTKSKTPRPNKGSELEEKEPHTVRSENLSREPEVSKTLSAQGTSSTLLHASYSAPEQHEHRLKRKSHDKEPGLLKEGARPGKKIRRQLDEVGVSAHPRKPSAAQLEGLPQKEERYDPVYPDVC
jgi:hypothetical protein